MEIEQTARPLQTNAHYNFPMAENAAYQCMENGGGKHAHIDMFVSHCACRVQCWDKVKDLDGSLENMLNVFSVLFGGNRANRPSVRDKCPCQFFHGRERSISMYGEWWGQICPHWHVCGSLCVSGTMLRQSQGPRRVPKEHAECFLSIVGHTNAEQWYH